MATMPPAARRCCSARSWSVVFVVLLPEGAAAIPAGDVHGGVGTGLFTVFSQCSSPTEKWDNTYPTKATENTRLQTSPTAGYIITCGLGGCSMSWWTRGRNIEPTYYSYGRVLPPCLHGGGDRGASRFKIP
ncbi:hypothetical protein SESBI_46924 [Sesbania bispinosa]|nr:hypothetical protein SESBI_46924 [Sesbania bispinosa]